ncbi:Tetratricopeptide repeat protein 21B, partial [Perkinsus olseni]
IHDYEKAIDYYKAALKRADSIPAATCSDLRRDLARLCLDLSRYQDCIQEIHRHLAVPHDEAAVDQVTDRIRSYLLLSEAHQKHHDSRVPGQDAARAGQLIPQSLDALKEAKELAVKALAAVGVVVGKKSGTGDDEDADVMPLKKLAGDVHYQLGCYLEHREHNFDAAVGQYTTALEFDEGKEDALMALARLRLSRGEIDSCERTLRALLRVDKGHEDADMMLASVMASKAQKALAASSGYSTEEGVPIEATDEFKAVVGHYKEMLDKDPSNFKALGQLLLLLRKTGRLAHLGPKYLEKAANSIPKGADAPPGLRHARLKPFCRGMLSRWLNQPQEAIVEFNASRKDVEYRGDAIMHMIEIYLFPDASDGCSLEGLDPTGSPVMTNIAEAKDLCRELAERGRQGWNPKLRVLRSQADLLTRNKATVDAALNDLMALYGSSTVQSYAVLSL